MVEFSPISSDKKIHDLKLQPNDSLPAPSLTLPSTKGPNSSVRIDGPSNVAKILSSRTGILENSNDEIDNNITQAMCLSLAAATKKHIGG